LDHVSYCLQMGGYTRTIRQQERGHRPPLNG
jgi:hypothetical protein